MCSCETAKFRGVCDVPQKDDFTGELKPENPCARLLENPKFDPKTVQLVDGACVALTQEEHMYDDAMRVCNEEKGHLRHVTKQTHVTELNSVYEQTKVGRAMEEEQSAS